jgi:hypothetical protein
MNNFIKLYGKVITALLFWFFIQFVCLVLTLEKKSHDDHLYPFTKYSFVETYDFTEFVIYGFGPIVLFIGFLLLKTSKHDN